jgi:hypothetical protein
VSDDPPFDLHEAFLGQQKALLAKLTAGRATGGHPVAVGDGTETGWRDVIQLFLPVRYQVSHGFVVDSTGTRSEQLDVIIHDRQYSPLLWELGGHFYVPAESVYAVFEVKQDFSLVHVEAAAQKASSVRRRKRTSGSFGWLGGHAKRELTPILAGLLVPTSEWNPPFGEPFRKAITGLPAEGRLDLGCVLDAGAWELPDPADPDSVVVTPPESSLVSFAMTLLQRLQALGTVGGIDYAAYQSSGHIR